MYVALATALIACTRVSLDPCGLGLPQLTVVTTDYQSGVVAAVDPITGTLCDPIAVVGPDPAIRSFPGQVAVFDRTGGSALRLYAPGDYRRPATEIGVEAGANVHDVLPVGDELWLTAYERDAILRLTASGDPLPGIDLAAYADADGLPEPDRFVATADGVYVGLQRLDRDDQWSGSTGRIVRIDPSTATIDADWEVGADPKLYPDPEDPRNVVALTGTFFAPDGELQVLDPDEGVSTVVTEAELGYDLDGFAGIGSHAVLLGVAFDIGGDSRFDCIDLETGHRIPGEEDPGWFVDAVAGEDRVYVASRTGWSGEPRDRILAVDPSDCAVDVLAEGFTLDPFGIAFVGG